MAYFDLKNGIIKAERRILKELGFCVHVKHPHKLIITYLQLIGHEKNKPLARRAWNYMNDSLRSDVFVRFTPTTIACACIYLAARNEKVPLPARPPWYELFDANCDDIEDIAISILRLYSRPKTKIAQLESIVYKLRKEKEKAEKEKTVAALKERSGSFTPSQNEDSNTVAPTNAVVQALLNNNNSKPSSRTNSPIEKQYSGKNTVNLKNGSSESKTKKRRPSVDSNSSTDSEIEEVSKKIVKRKREEEKSRKRRSPISEPEERADRRASSKVRRSASPDDRRKKNSKDIRSRDTNGHSDKNHSRSKKRSRSRSPIKKRSPSPASRKDKHREREREKTRTKDKYSSRSRR